jgi:hypothetical protein
MKGCNGRASASSLHQGNSFPSHCYIASIQHLEKEFGLKLFYHVL